MLARLRCPTAVALSCTYLVYAEDDEWEGRKRLRLLPFRELGFHSGDVVHELDHVKDARSRSGK